MILAKHNFKFLLVLTGIFLCLSFTGKAQSESKLIQFSGVIVGEDSLRGVPGVHIYVPKARRGTTSNVYGYFSMPVLPHDSVVISAVGYKRRSFKISDDQGSNITVVIELFADTTYLPTIEIFPYPTEELFKEAILALNIPLDEYQLEKNLGDQILAEMTRATPMDAAMNHDYYMQQQFYQMHNRYSIQDPLMAITNPFAWAQFIKSIKSGAFKKKE